jgi:hypothetical protein
LSFCLFGCLLVCLMNFIIYIYGIKLLYYFFRLSCTFIYFCITANYLFSFCCCITLGYFYGNS